VPDDQPRSGPPGRAAASSARLVVGIAGESDHGTRSLAGALTAALGAERVARLCHDAYHHDAAGGTAAADADDTVPPAIDHGLLLEHVSALRAGQAVRPPAYCTVTQRRTGYGPSVPPRPIVVVDGALLLWEPDVRAALDLSIYLDRAARGRPEPTTMRSVLARWVDRTRAMADLVLSAGPIERVAEIATAVVLDRLARGGGARARLAS
jgi:uridine kinase